MVKLLNLKQVAEILGMSVRNIYRFIKEDLPAFKVGVEWRVKERELEKWVESKQTGKRYLYEETDIFDGDI